MAESQSSIRRILVALDASRASLSALRNAVELADRFDAELMGLFVEDINLLRAAQWPFTREVSFFSMTLRPLESIELERQLRAQAEQIRRIMARTAERRGIRWEFRITRGSVTREILTAGAEADLMVLGKIGRSFPGAYCTGSTLRTVVMQRPGLTLILRAGELLTMPVMVVFDGSDKGVKALEVAGHLVDAREGRLTVLVAADDRDEARRLQITAMEYLASRKIGADFRLLVQPTLSGLVRLLGMESNGPVVIPCGKKPFQEKLCDLVEEASNPVLLVR